VSVYDFSRGNNQYFDTGDHNRGIERGAYAACRDDRGASCIDIPGYDANQRTNSRIRAENSMRHAYATHIWQLYIQHGWRVCHAAV